MIRKITVFLLIFFIFICGGCQRTYRINNSVVKTFRTEMMDKFESIEKITITSNQPDLNIIYKSNEEIPKEYRLKLLLTTIDYIMKDGRIEQLIHNKFKDKESPDVVVEFNIPRTTISYEGNYNRRKSINEIENYDTWDISYRSNDSFYDYLSIINMKDVLIKRSQITNEDFVYKLRIYSGMTPSDFIIENNKKSEQILIEDKSLRKTLMYRIEYMTTFTEAKKIPIDECLYTLRIKSPACELIIFETSNQQFIKFNKDSFIVEKKGLDLKNLYSNSK